MNSFSVEFDDDVTFNNMVAGILSVANNGQFHQEGSTFTFKAEWKTDQKSLNNLKGKIELTSGSNSIEEIKAV